MGIKKLRSKLTASVVLLCFTLQAVGANGAPRTIDTPRPALSSSLSIDPDSGFIKESRLTGSDQLVIYVQDYHANPSVQYTISRIIQSIARQTVMDEHGIYKEQEQPRLLVGLEGHCGTYDTRYIREKQHLPEKEMVIDYFFLKGYLNGAEYLDLTKDNGLFLYGIDNEELYAQNRTLFLKCADQKGAWSAQLDAMEHAVQSESDRTFSGSAKEFSAMTSAYLTNNIDIVQWSHTLKAAQEKYGIDLTPYPAVAQLLHVVQLESAISYRHLEQQINIFTMRELYPALDEEGRWRMMNMFNSYRDQEIEQLVYAEALIDLSSQLFPAKQEQFKQNYPDLYTYAELKDKLDACKTNFGSEDDTTFRAFFDHLAQAMLSDNEYTVYTRMMHVKELRKLLELQISSEEWADISTHIQALKSLAASSSPELPVALEDSIRFYETALMRDTSLADNLIAQMQQGYPVAVLLAGGFHTDGIIESLKAKKCDYIVIQPAVHVSDNAQASGENLYYTVMSGKKSELEQKLDSYVARMVAPPSFVSRLNWTLTMMQALRYRLPRYVYAGVLAVVIGIVTATNLDFIKTKFADLLPLITSPQAEEQYVAEPQVEQLDEYTIAAQSNNLPSAVSITAAYITNGALTIDLDIAPAQANTYQAIVLTKRGEEWRRTINQNTYLTTYPVKNGVQILEATDPLNADSTWVLIVDRKKMAAGGIPYSFSATDAKKYIDGIAVQGTLIGSQVRQNAQAATQDDLFVHQAQSNALPDSQQIVSASVSNGTVLLDIQGTVDGYKALVLRKAGNEWRVTPDKKRYSSLYDITPDSQVLEGIMPFESGQTWVLLVNPEQASAITQAGRLEEWQAAHYLKDAAVQGTIAYSTTEAETMRLQAENLRFIQQAQSNSLPGQSVINEAFILNGRLHVDLNINVDDRYKLAVLTKQSNGWRLVSQAVTARSLYNVVPGEQILEGSSSYDPNNTWVVVIDPSKQDFTARGVIPEDELYFALRNSIVQGLLIPATSEAQAAQIDRQNIFLQNAQSNTLPSNASIESAYIMDGALHYTLNITPEDARKYNIMVLRRVHDNWITTTAEGQYSSIIAAEPGEQKFVPSMPIEAEATWIVLVDPQQVNFRRKGFFSTADEYYYLNPAVAQGTIVHDNPQLIAEKRAEQAQFLTNAQSNGLPGDSTIVSAFSIENSVYLNVDLTEEQAAHYRAVIFRKVGNEWRLVPQRHTVSSLFKIKPGGQILEGFSDIQPDTAWVMIVDPDKLDVRQLSSFTDNQAQELLQDAAVQGSLITALDVFIPEELDWVISYEISPGTFFSLDYNTETDSLLLIKQSFLEGSNTPSVKTHFLVNMRNDIIIDSSEAPVEDWKKDAILQTVVDDLETLMTIASGDGAQDAANGYQMYQITQLASQIRDMQRERELERQVISGVEFIMSQDYGLPTTISTKTRLTYAWYGEGVVAPKALNNYSRAFIIDGIINMLEKPDRIVIITGETDPEYILDNPNTLYINAEDVINASIEANKTWTDHLNDLFDLIKMRLHSGASNMPDALRETIEEWLAESGIMDAIVQSPGSFDRLGDTLYAEIDKLKIEPELKDSIVNTLSLSIFAVLGSINVRGGRINFDIEDHTVQRISRNSDDEQQRDLIVISPELLIAEIQANQFSSPLTRMFSQLLIRYTEHDYNIFIPVASQEEKRLIEAALRISGIDQDLDMDNIRVMQVANNDYPLGIILTQYPTIDWNRVVVFESDKNLRQSRLLNYSVSADELTQWRDLGVKIIGIDRTAILPDQWLLFADYIVDLDRYQPESGELLRRIKAYYRDVFNDERPLAQQTVQTMMNSLDQNGYLELPDTPVIIRRILQDITTVRHTLETQA